MSHILLWLIYFLFYFCYYIFLHNDQNKRNFNLLYDSSSLSWDDNKDGLRLWTQRYFVHQKRKKRKTNTGQDNRNISILTFRDHTYDKLHVLYISANHFSKAQHKFLYWFSSFQAAAVFSSFQDKMEIYVLAEIWQKSACDHYSTAVNIFIICIVKVTFGQNVESQLLKSFAPTSCVVRKLYIMKKKMLFFLLLLLL